MQLLTHAEPVDIRTRSGSVDGAPRVEQTSWGHTTYPLLSTWATCLSRGNAPHVCPCTLWDLDLVDQGLLKCVKVVGLPFNSGQSYEIKVKWDTLSCCVKPHLELIYASPHKYMWKFKVMSSFKLCLLSTSALTEHRGMHCGTELCHSHREYT